MVTWKRMETMQETKLITDVPDAIRRWKGMFSGLVDKPLEAVFFLVIGETDKTLEFAGLKRDGDWNVYVRDEEYLIDEVEFFDWEDYPGAVEAIADGSIEGQELYLTADKSLSKEEVVTLVKGVKALERVIESGVDNMEYMDRFYDELAKLGVDDTKVDYSDIFELALIKKGLI